MAEQRTADDVIERMEFTSAMKSVDKPDAWILVNEIEVLRAKLKDAQRCLDDYRGMDVPDFLAHRNIRAVGVEVIDHTGNVIHATVQPHRLEFR